jgi:hypothetical protein
MIIRSLKIVLNSSKFFYVDHICLRLFVIYSLSIIYFMLN